MTCKHLFKTCNYITIIIRNTRHELDGEFNFSVNISPEKKNVNFIPYLRILSSESLTNLCQANQPFTVKNSQVE